MTISSEFGVERSLPDDKIKVSFGSATIIFNVKLIYLTANNRD